MLREMADLGFEYVELSHGIRITLVPGILRAVKEGIVKVSSTHNFCPLPTGVMQAAPNLYEPSSSDGQEHEQWIRHTKRSLDFAAQVEARALVCHLGSVKFSWFNPTDKLESYLEKHPGAGRGNVDSAYETLRRKACDRLRRRMTPYWEQVLASVREILPYAREKGVRLGCENRERFDELPLDDDWAKFLGHFGPETPVGYWHDTGHAELKAELGLLRPFDHLAVLASRIVGFHLHDVSAEGRDHQPVGAGRVDFEMISRFWRPGHLLTLELSPRVAVDDVRRSKERIEALVK